MSGRLAAVLARAIALIEDGHGEDAKADALVAAIPEPDREALEAGLGRCVWNDCGRLEDDPWHGDPDAHEHDPRLTCHPFVPFGAAP